MGCLVQEYGIDALARLWESVLLPPGIVNVTPDVFVTGVLPEPPATPTAGAEPEPAAPDYEGVYGRSLDGLEREWLGTSDE